MSSLLSVKDLSVNYGSIAAIRNVSFEVPEKSIVTLIGCNGAGKSTILKTISGLLNPKSGSIVYRGQPIQGTAAYKLVRFGICHSPEGRGVFPSLTVLENLEMGAYTSPRDRSRVNLEKALTLFPRLQERLQQKAGTLSGGEQQMLAMGRALMAEPKLLLLDEPSLGLAPQIVQALFQIIIQINQMGTTVLLVEQNARMALKIAHRGYVLETGSLTLSGTGEDLLSNQDVQKSYLGG